MLDSHTGNALPTFHNEVHGNIILGIVRTLEFDQVSNFLLTLHKTGYTGTVGFFVMIYLKILYINFRRWEFIKRILKK